MLSLVMLEQLFLSVQPFSMATLPPLGNPNKQLADALKQLSAAKYGRPKMQVTSEITKRLATAPTRPSLPPSAQSIFDKYNMPATQASAAGLSQLPGQTSSLPPAPTSFPPFQAAQSPKGSSFLDEWLEKRKSTAARPPTTPKRVSSSAPPPATAATKQSPINSAETAASLNQEFIIPRDSSSPKT
jgi:hypothetical protein